METDVKNKVSITKISTKTAKYAHPTAKQSTHATSFGNFVNFRDKSCGILCGIQM